MDILLHDFQCIYKVLPDQSFVHYLFSYELYFWDLNLLEITDQKFNSLRSDKGYQNMYEVNCRKTSYRYVTRGLRKRELTCTKLCSRNFLWTMTFRAIDKNLPHLIDVSRKWQHNKGLLHTYLGFRNHWSAKKFKISFFFDILCILLTLLCHHSVHLCGSPVSILARKLPTDFTCFWRQSVQQRTSQNRPSTGEIQTKNLTQMIPQHYH
jgi:hypothetical protein